MLVLVIGVAGYYGYQFFFPDSPPPALRSSYQSGAAVEEPLPQAAAPQAKPTTVDFVIRSRVKKLFEEWKRRKLAYPGHEIGASGVKPAEEFSEIRKALFHDRDYAEEAVYEAVVKALRELHVAEDEINEVAVGVLNLQ